MKFCFYKLSDLRGPGDHNFIQKRPLDKPEIKIEGRERRRKRESKIEEERERKSVVNSNKL